MSRQRWKGHGEPGLGRESLDQVGRDLDSDEGFRLHSCGATAGAEWRSGRPQFFQRVSWFSAGELEPGRHFQRPPTWSGEEDRLKPRVSKQDGEELDRQSG